MIGLLDIVPTPDIKRTILYWRSQRNVTPALVYQQVFKRRPWCPITWDLLAALLTVWEAREKRPDPPEAREFRRRHPPSR